VRIFALIFAAIVLLGSPAWARDLYSGTDAAFLQRSCGELVKIYETRDQRSFLAAQLTSLSEAMRAGYCIGTIQEYLRAGGGCSRDEDWHAYALRIAVQSPVAARGSREQLLRKAIPCAW